MADRRAILPSEPEKPQPCAPPCLRDRAGLSPVGLVFILAAAIVLAPGPVLFGWNTVRVLVICVGSALLTDYAARAALGRNERGTPRNALLLGMLTACTMPPAVHWPAPLVAAALAVAAGHALAGGLGGCLWHPVALGRVAVQMLFTEELTPERWPVLGPGHLLWGDLSAARPLPLPATWISEPLPYGVQAWEMLRPADVLTSAIPAPADATPAEALTIWMRDVLPPWSHTLTGVAGGAIGEACGLAVVLAGLLLMWRGLARPFLPMAGVLMAAIAAAILPLAVRPEPGTLVWHWLPGLDVQNGLPVGVLYVLYHLTAGEFLFVLMVLAAGPTSMPLSGRGQALFGGMIGGLTVALRVAMGLPAAGYWALLIANTLVPAIKHYSARS